ncbi:GGDEF domain-containing protein [Actinoplanes oblitus]|uniref:GGDEF domain-containing protein n=1 Tax=Actinoplanes oblitus TaxID=3040509 RepID=A0ABY8WD12_9ACTN|nr:GGDEF domain-containing protein [Actinoplanes oblitus]WIM94289.1 GGDEF domain-containing protein [Actinoplanes oblitus]
MSGGRVRAARAALIGLTVGLFALAAAGGAGRWVLGGVLAADLVLLAVCGRALFHRPADERQLPSHDGLTGLPNRAMMVATVERALPVAAAEQQSAGLLVFDLDDVGDVNYALGQRIGDLLLAEAASRLSAAVRDTDTVARIGDDEFAVLLPRIGSAAACLETARRLLDALRGPADLDGFQVRIDAAVGAAVYPAHAATPAELFQRAEASTRAAKQTRSATAMFGSPAPGDRPALPFR